jgi:hypothetical protein
LGNRKTVPEWRNPGHNQQVGDAGQGAGGDHIRIQAAQRLDALRMYRRLDPAQRLASRARIPPFANRIPPDAPSSASAAPESSRETPRRNRYRRWYLPPPESTARSCRESRMCRSHRCDRSWDRSDCSPSATFQMRGKGRIRSAAVASTR